MQFSLCGPVFEKKKKNKFCIAKSLRPVDFWENFEYLSFCFYIGFDSQGQSM